MLRTRVIKPGVVWNEDLAALGPEATLLFERLWMLADREGRVEDRPARIRAEAFPYWPEFPVENLLEKLSEKGLIQRYHVRECSIVYIPTFHKHQPVHPNEAKSTLPAKPLSRSKSRRLIREQKVPNVITCPDIPGNFRLPLSLPLPSISGGEEPARGFPASGAETPPPPIQNQTPTPNTTPPPRKPPLRSPVIAPSAAPDTPGTPEERPDFAIVRDSLRALARELRRPAPDDDLVRRVLSLAQGASGDEIHATLVRAYKAGRLQGMRTWGLVTTVVQNAFVGATA